MRAIWHLAATLLMGALSCKPSGAPKAQLATPSPTTAPGPLLLPKVILPDGTVAIHASTIGWTADGSHFGFCGAFGEGMAEVRCFEAGVDGTIRSVDQISRKAHSRAPAERNSPIWPYGGMLHLTWDVQPPAYLEHGPPHLAATFVLSGGALGESSTYVLDRLIPSPDNPDVEVHVDAIIPSPDGSSLGVVVHAYSGEWSDTYHLRTWSTDDLASRTFSRIGKAYQQRGEHDKSAAYFKLATQASEVHLPEKRKRTPSPRIP